MDDPVCTGAKAVAVAEAKLPAATLANVALACKHSHQHLRITSFRL